MSDRIARPLLTYAGRRRKRLNVACLKHRNGVLPTDRAAPLVRLEHEFPKCSLAKPRWLPTRRSVAAERAYRNPRLAGRQRNQTSRQTG